jgi:hypothetical protein
VTADKGIQGATLQLRVLLSPGFCMKSGKARGGRCDPVNPDFILSAIDRHAFKQGLVRRLVYKGVHLRATKNTLHFGMPFAIVTSESTFQKTWDVLEDQITSKKTRQTKADADQNALFGLQSWKGLAIGLVVAFAAGGLSVRIARKVQAQRLEQVAPVRYAVVGTMDSEMVGDVYEPCCVLLFARSVCRVCAWRAAVCACSPADRSLVTGWRSGGGGGAEEQRKPGHGSHGGPVPRAPL